jgi:hypothetical protein
MLFFLLFQVLLLMYIVDLLEENDSDHDYHMLLLLLFLLMLEKQFVGNDEYMVVMMEVRFVKVFRWLIQNDNQSDCMNVDRQVINSMVVEMLNEMMILYH